MTTLTVNNRNLNAFLGIYDNLVFFIVFLYLLQILQYILTYLDSTANVLRLFCHSLHIH